MLDQATAYFERVLWDTEAGAPVREYLASRGLGEEVGPRVPARALARAPGSSRRRARAASRVDELRAAGLANQRGNDYFPFRLMFPLADARGRVIGFQARKLRDDDPLRGKYVNTPESELFKKGAVLYGLHLARPAIAKQDRAVVVEGNTDVIALRQAGVEPVVASMGTALTEQQLRELGRLTKRLYLCFDADAAGQEATLRGMELAVSQGFDVRVVSLPPGQDPADAPDGFVESARWRRELPPLPRAHRDRAGGGSPGGVRAGARGARRRSRTRPSARRRCGSLADRLDLPRETLSGIAPARVGAAGRTQRRLRPEPPRILEAGLRLERDALAACLAHPELVPLLATLAPEHFVDPVHRRFRALLVEGGEEDDELTALRAELGARAERDALDQKTGQELLLRLRERRLRRELQEADLVRATELQAHLAKVRQAIAELA